MPRCFLCSKLFPNSSDFGLLREVKSKGRIGVCKFCIQREDDLPPWVNRLRKEEEEKNSRARLDAALKSSRKRAGAPPKSFLPPAQESEDPEENTYVSNFYVEYHDIREEKYFSGHIQNLKPDGFTFDSLNPINEATIIGIFVKTMDGVTLLADTGKVVKNELVEDRYKISVIYVDDKERVYVKERRKNKRIDINMRIEFWKAANDTHKIGQVYNFSKGGLCFTYEKYITNMPMINFMLLLGEDDSERSEFPGIQPFSGIAKVVNIRKTKDGNCFIHVNFMSIKK